MFTKIAMYKYIIRILRNIKNNSDSSDPVLEYNINSYINFFRRKLKRLEIKKDQCRIIMEYDVEIDWENPF